MEIKKGNRFVCVKDVVMEGVNDVVAYIKGNVYISESDNYITNEMGNSGHIWKGDGEEKYFIPYSKLDSVYTKYTERLEKLFDAYEEKKATTGDDIKFFDNVVGGDTGWLVSTGGLDEDYFLSRYYTYLSEQAFIEFMGLTYTPDTTSPQAHYDNSNGSLFSLAEQLGLNHWEFDILKRLVRCRKKGQLKEDLQKIKDTCDIYLKESPH